MSESVAPPVLQAARFLIDHATEPVRLEDVADHVGYSRFHLARTFERALGQPPGRFLASHRFQLAKRLLLTRDDRIIDICCALGFDSLGTFTRRFTSEVGLSPTAFRRLPDQLVDTPPRPVHLPGGATDGGVLTGTVELGARARAALGAEPAIYVGLFPQFAARGIPTTGSLLAGTGTFTFTGVPSGTYWLLGTALPTAGDARDQLTPSIQVLGSYPAPLRISPRQPVEHRSLVLDLAPEWTAPVLVALPPLAVPGAQHRRSPRRGPAPSLRPGDS